ncbi:MAG: hypothetical protein H7A37_04170 [Chlamydiales bacterium]|nr:hypothetical protein [Chlamydiia bacterium]MCP5507482.1 hypothetical protein [Chlamydiales bacterium]
MQINNTLYYLITHETLSGLPLPESLETDDQKIRYIYSTIMRCLQRPAHVLSTPSLETIKATIQEEANCDNDKINELEIIIKHCRLSIPPLEKVNEQIEKLFLAPGYISHVPDFVSLRLTNLKQLVLSHNPLKILPENFLVNSTELEVLHLDDCQLSSLPRDFGKTWKKLKHLEITHNNFEEIPKGFGSSWKRLITLSIGDVKEKIVNYWPNATVNVYWITTQSDPSSSGAVSRLSAFKPSS